MPGNDRILGGIGQGGVKRPVDPIVLQTHVFQAQITQAGGGHQDQYGQVPGPPFHLQGGVQAQGQDETIGQINGVDEVAVRNEELKQKGPGQEIKDHAGQEQIPEGSEPGRQGAASRFGKGPRRPPGGGWRRPCRRPPVPNPGRGR